MAARPRNAVLTDVESAPLGGGVVDADGEEEEADEDPPAALDEPEVWTAPEPVEEPSEAVAENSAPAAEGRTTPTDWQVAAAI